jgi:hypothetical protein
VAEAEGNTPAAPARVKRPHFFADPALDQMMSIVLALAEEVSVLRDRVDAGERLLDRNGVLTRADLERYVPDAAAEAERQARRADYLARLFRVIRRDAGSFGTAEAEAHVAGIEQQLAGG